MKKLICPAVLLGCMLLVSLAPAIAQAKEEIGIDRSNLTRQSEAVQEKTLRDIHALGGHGSMMVSPLPHPMLSPSL